MVLAALTSTASAERLEPSVVSRECERSPVCIGEFFADALVATPSEPRELRMDGVIAFEPGTARVYSAGREKLQRLAEDWQKQTNWTRIIVEGYAGPSAVSDELAQRRADIISHYLVKYGVDPAFVVSIGRGKAKAQGHIDLTIELL